MYRFLCTQLFSRTVADSLQFYRKQGLEGLKNSEGTEEFTRVINNLFDSLNAGIPSDGVKFGSEKYKVSHHHTFSDAQIFLFWINYL